MTKVGLIDQGIIAAGGRRLASSRATQGRQKYCLMRQRGKRYRYERLVSHKSLHPLPTNVLSKSCDGSGPVGGAISLLRTWSTECKDGRFKLQNVQKRQSIGRRSDELLKYTRCRYAIYMLVVVHGYSTGRRRFSVK